MRKTYLSIVIVVLSIILGSCFSLFFLDSSTGLSVPVFVGLYILSIILMKLFKGGIRSFNGFDLLFLPLFLSSFGFAMHQNTTLLGLTGVILVFFLTPLSFFSVFSKELERFSYLNSFLLYLNNLITSSIAIPDFLQGIFVTSSKVGNVKNFRRYLLSFLLGVIIVIPIAAVFLALLASADDAFREILLDTNLSIDLNFVFLAIVMSAIFVASFIGIFLADSIKVFLNQKYNESRSKGLSSITVSVVLLGLVFILTSFTVIQFIYYYGDHDKVVELGLTYSEYARQGFWELQFVSILAFLLTYTLLRFTAASTLRAKLVTKSLFLIFIINVLFVIFSAHSRMNLYENGYGYTELRLFPHVFMLFEAILFIYLAFVVIYRKGFRYFSVFSFVLGLTFIIGLNIANPDRIIARRNIDRYENGKQLDVEYLLSLSSDAYLELEEVEFAAKDLYLCELVVKRDRLLEKNENWYEANYSRHQAIEKIDEMTGDLDRAKCDEIVEENVENFLNNYEQALIEKDYARAVTYWNQSEGSTNLSDKVPESVSILSLDTQIKVTEDYHEWEISLFGDNDDEIDYYTDFDKYLEKNIRLKYSNSRDDSVCDASGYLSLVLVDGEFMIDRFSSMPLVENGYYKESSEGTLMDMAINTSSPFDLCESEIYFSR